VKRTATTTPLLGFTLWVYPGWIIDGYPALLGVNLVLSESLTVKMKPLIINDLKYLKVIIIP